MTAPPVVQPEPEPEPEPEPAQEPEPEPGPPAEPGEPDPEPEPPPFVRPWIPDAPIRLGLRRLSSYPDLGYVGYGLSAETWRSIIGYASAAFARSYIRVELLGPHAADVHAVVDVIFTTTGHSGDAFGGAGWTNRADGLRSPRISLYMTVFNAGYPPRHERWTELLGHIVAHELMHIIDMDCPHASGEGTSVFDAPAPGFYTTNRFGDHARQCIVNLDRPPATHPDDYR